MPLFEYICRDCGRPAELLVTAGRKPVCPSCGSARLDKQLSAFTPRAPSAPLPPCAASCPSGGCGCHGPCACHSH